jgi:tetratricopeptide (TPR) repeat protein
MEETMKAVLLLPVILLASLAAAQPPPSAGAPFADEWPRIVADFERSVLEGDTAGLRRGVEACKRWRQMAPPAQQPLVHYAVAYNAWRLVHMREVKPAEREALLEEAVKSLQEAIRLDPRFAEAKALLAGVYGAQMADSPMSGMTLGPRAGSLRREALAAEPNNPRVVLQEGLSAFHTPPMFGGSLEKAETSLRRALALFAQEPVSRPWPNWGRFDAHVWLGQALAKKGDRVGARAEYEAALRVAPRSEWVLRVLLPQVVTPAGGR